MPNFSQSLQNLVAKQTQTLVQINKTLNRVSPAGRSTGTMGFTGVGNIPMGTLTTAHGVMSSQTMLGGMGTGLTGLGQAANMFGPYGQAAGGVLQFVGEMAKGVDSLQSWDRALLDSKFQMAEVSPAMAAVKVEQQMRDIAFNIKQGEKIAGVTSDLGEAFTNLRNETSGLEKEWLKLRFRFTTGLARIFHFWNPETFGENLFTTNEFKEMWNRTGENKNAMDKMDDLSSRITAFTDEGYLQFFGRPPRFPQHRPAGVLNRPAARP